MRIWVVEYFKRSKSIDVRRGEETKQIILCFLEHGGGCAHVLAEPLMWVERWSSGGKACFMTKVVSQVWLWFLVHCSSAAFRQRREERERWFSERHRLDLVRSDGGLPILAKPHDMDGFKFVRMNVSEKQIFVTRGSMDNMILR